MDYLQLLELHSGGLSSGSSLQPGKDSSNLELALLLHPATDASPEEHLGVPKPELLFVQLDNVHHGTGSSFVVLCLGHCRSSQDVVAPLELRVVDLQKICKYRQPISECNLEDDKMALMFMKSMRNSALLGKPARQMAIPARTPLHWY